MKNYSQLLFTVLSLLTSFNFLQAQWAPTDSTSHDAVLSLTVTADGTKLIAGTNGDGVYYSTDNGTNWCDANLLLNGPYVRSFAMSGTNLFAGTEQGVFLSHSTDFGSDSWEGWSEKISGLNDKNVLSLAVSSDGTKLYAGTSSGIFLSTNNGTNWTEINNGLTNTYVNAIVVSGANLFAATIGGGVFRSTNFGTNWSTVNSGLTNNNVFAIAVSPNGVGSASLFVGTDDGVFLSTDDGASWSAASTGLTSTDVNCLLVNGTNLFLGTFDGGIFLSTNNVTNWNAVNTNITNTYVNALAVSGTNLFVGTSAVSVTGSFSVNVTPLPVELTSFTASVNRNAVVLNWNTANEANNYGFEVQRSVVSNQPVGTLTQTIVNTNWEKIGFIEGHGSTNTLQSYSFVDRSASGKVVYRLKQTDRDGKFEYSQEVEATVTAPQVFALSQNYPNPFNPTTNIEFTVPFNGRATLKVFNIVGQEVATIFNGEVEAGKYNQVQFNASGLATGVYFSRLEYDGKILLKKMLLTK
jgi:hypothetical protein